MVSYYMITKYGVKMAKPFFSENACLFNIFQE